jgi:uncharacterized protein
VFVKAHSIFLAILAATASPVSAAQLRPAGIPPPPASQDFVSDFARLLSPDAKTRIAAAQKTAFETHNTPIVVVTIRRMSDYGMTGVSIEDFARQWFDHWRIGTLDARESGANKGILLLVSGGDRRARIELGADWGRNWDDACLDIMDGVIVPEFKRGNYSEGIARGVEQLAEMASKGPSSPPPPADLITRLSRTAEQDPRFKRVTAYSLFSPRTILLLGGLGVLLIALSFFVPGMRKFLLVTGIVLVVGALFTWLVLFVTAVFLKGKGRSIGGGYSGGGFSGGFSGGGGASGRW